MDTNSQQLEHRDGFLSSLNTAIEAMAIAKDATRMPPAKAAFTSVGVILNTARVGFPPVHVY